MKIPRDVDAATLCKKFIFLIIKSQGRREATSGFRQIEMVNITSLFRIIRQ